MTKDNIPYDDYQSKYLDDEHPILIKIPIARALNSDRQAYFVQQVRYWIYTNKNKPRNQSYFNDGRFWMYNTLDDWHEQFPWLSVSTIRRIINELKLRGILITGNYNKKRYDKTVWYAIDERKLDELIDEHMSVWTKCPHGSGQNVHMDLDKMSEPIPETLTENKKERVQPEKTPAPAQSSSNDNAAAFNETIDLYYNLYQEQFNVKPAINKGKDHALLKQLLNDYGAEMVQYAIKEHITNPDDWTRQGGCTIGQLKHNFNGYLVEFNEIQERRRKREREDEEARKRNELLRQHEEEEARKRAEFEALPEVEKARARLKQKQESLAPLKEMRESEARRGQTYAIEKMHGYLNQERELIEAVGAAGGDEAGQLLQEVEKENQRLKDWYIKITAEVPF